VSDRTQIEWVQGEISTAAARLLASRREPFDLHQRESEAKGYTICLSSMVSPMSEEPPPRSDGCAECGDEPATSTEDRLALNRTRNPKRGSEAEPLHPRFAIACFRGFMSRDLFRLRTGLESAFELRGEPNVFSD
jgi:hypothetical protein